MNGWSLMIACFVDLQYLFSFWLWPNELFDWDCGKFNVTTPNYKRFICNSVYVSKVPKHYCVQDIGFFEAEIGLMLQLLYMMSMKNINKHLVNPFGLFFAMKHSQSELALFSPVGNFSIASCLQV